ncbi:MAG TPA: hypothetical protein VEC35_00870 [Noviherbaspirillum sp.]|nr:hypothetical protein [Noviherbaspirillum sp.]
MLRALCPSLGVTSPAQEEGGEKERNIHSTLLRVHCGIWRALCFKTTNMRTKILPLGIIPL